MLSYINNLNCSLRTPLSISNKISIFENFLEVKVFSNWAHTIMEYFYIVCSTARTWSDPTNGGQNIHHRVSCRAVLPHGTQTSIPDGWPKVCQGLARRQWQLQNGQVNPITQFDVQFSPSSFSMLLCNSTASVWREFIFLLSS